MEIIVVLLELYGIPVLDENVELESVPKHCQLAPSISQQTQVREPVFIFVEIQFIL